MPPDQFYDSDDNLVRGSDSDYLTIGSDYFNFAIDSEEDDNINL